MPYICIEYVFTDAETLLSDITNNFEIRRINVIMQLKYFHNHVNETKISQIQNDKKSF